jgi:hypothetical protein
MLVRPPRHRVVAVVPLCSLLLSASCSTTATIDRRDGFPFEGRIDRSDQGAVYLDEGNGSILRVDRREITDIDHPGNVSMTVGAIATLLFGSALASSSAHDARFESPERAYALGAVGLGLLIWGGYYYYRSRSAARAYEEAPVYVRVPSRPAELPQLPLPDAGARD